MTPAVRSIPEYLQIIDHINEIYPSDRKSALIFRGASSFHHKLIPGVFRTYLRDCPEGPVLTPCYGGTTENEILHHFIKNAMSIVEHIDKDDLLTWLTYAQHFGAPTRLLDFSSNPLISLYFACKRNHHLDGSVYIFHARNYVNNLQLNASPLRKKKNVLQEIIESIQDPAKECTPYPVAFIPHFIDNRMEAQESRFLVWGSLKISLESIAEPHGSMLEGRPDAYFCKLPIAGEEKQNLLRELSFLGINEKRLFPGLDGIGRYVSDYYRVTEDYSQD